MCECMYAGATVDSTNDRGGQYTHTHTYTQLIYPQMQPVQWMMKDPLAPRPSTATV